MVSKMQEEDEGLVAPLLSSLSPAVRRTFTLMERRNLPPPPKAVAEPAAARQLMESPPRLTALEDLGDTCTDWDRLPPHFL